MPAPKLRHFDDQPHVASGLAASAVAAQANRILASAAFQKANRLARFLAYAVENALAGREDVLKETVLGIEVFDWGAGFDPRLDAIVRIDARRLRAWLAEYYQSEGAGDPIVIEFEPGSYVPRFRSAAETAPAGRAAAPKGVKALLALSQLAAARKQLHFLTPGGIVKSVGLFERIIAGHPEHPLAYVGHATASIAAAMFFYESPHTAMPRARLDRARARPRPRLRRGARCARRPACALRLRLHGRQRGLPHGPAPEA